MSRGIAIACGGLLALAACPRAERAIDLADPRLLRIDSTDAIIVDTSGDVGGLAFQRYLTPAEGVGAVGRPVAGAMDRIRDALIVADGSSCTLTSHDRRTGDVIGTIGRCGEGPGELRTIGGVHPEADSIRVIDYGARSIVTLPRLGVGSRKVPFAPIVGGEWLTRILGVDGDTVIGLWTVVGKPDAGARSRMKLLRWTQGSATVRAAGITDPAVADEGTGQVVIGQSGCTQPDGSGLAPAVVVASSWMHEAVVVRDREPGVTRIVTTMAWDTIVRPPPERVASTPFRRVVAVCGDRLFAVYREGLGGRSDAVPARLEIRRYDGALLTAREALVGLERELPIPLALDGTRLFAIVSDGDGLPRIGEFEVGNPDK